MINFRKSLLINPPFQTKFIIYTMAPSLLCILVLFFCGQFYFTEAIEQLSTIDDEATQSTLLILITQHQKFNILLLVFTFSIISLYALWGLVISHRIAGPLLKLTNFLKKSEPTTEVDYLQFRKDDFFQEIPEALNQFLKKFNINIKEKPEPKK